MNNQANREIAEDSPLKDVLKTFQGTRLRTARKILTVALDTKQISTYEIALLLNKDDRSGITFKLSMGTLIKILLESGIQPSFVAKREYPNLRKNKKVQRLLVAEQMEMDGLTYKHKVFKKFNQELREESEIEIESTEETGQENEKEEVSISGTFSLRQPDPTFEWFKNTACNHDIFDHESVCKLIRTAQAGNYEARNLVITHNQKLVASIAKNYTWSGQDIMDLVQEGTFGLIEAIEKFDESLGNQFSTYATWWINQKITRSIQDERHVVRIPVHMQEQVRAYKKIVDRLTQELGRIPNDDEIFEASGIESDGKIKETAKFGITSTDQPRYGVNDEESDSTFGDGIINYYDYSADQIMTAKEELSKRTAKVKTLIQLVKGLNISSRNKRFFLLYYNLSTEKIPGGHTLDKIGDYFELTHERVRQVNQSIWKKLGELNCPINRHTVNRELTAFSMLEDFTNQVVDF